MEIKVLRCFLAVVEHHGISAAAEALGVSQPTVSWQLQALEDEIGAPLFVRGTRGHRLTLTREGRVLFRRAQEIVALADRTMHELTSPDDDVSGEVGIGAAEADVMRLVAGVAVAVRRRHPRIRFNIRSGSGPQVVEQLDGGLVDFGVLIEPVDLSQYNHLQLPVMDSWSVVMRRAAHNILYTAVNSWRYENGEPDSGMPVWQVAMIAADVVIGVLLVGLEALAVKRCLDRARAAKAKA